MKKGKIVLTVIAVCVVCFAAFVLIDCVRISRAELGTKPLITISEEIPNGPGDLRYRGLGYSVVYKMGDEMQTGDSGESCISYIEENAYGQEFWLFDKILVWGWVE